MARAQRKLKVEPVIESLRLDLGCGPNKRDGFRGVDTIAFPGVDHVLDLRVAPWPWADGSVAEARASHFIEHLTAYERITFVNELYRVLEPGGTCEIVVPHWASCRAYGDPTHLWPPVSEMWFFYLDRDWRSKQAPHTDVSNWSGGFACDFLFTCGYALHQELGVKNDSYKQFAVQNYKEACQDIIATLTRRSSG